MMREAKAPSQEGEKDPSGLGLDHLLTVACHLWDINTQRGSRAMGMRSQYFAVLVSPHILAPASSASWGN